MHRARPPAGDEPSAILSQTQSWKTRLTMGKSEPKLYNWASATRRNHTSDSFVIQFSASCSDAKPLTYCIRPLTHRMKTRQPSPAGEGTASNAANLSVNGIRVTSGKCCRNRLGRHSLGV